MIRKVFSATAIVAFIAVVAILYAIVFAVPKIQGLAVRTEIVEYAELPVQDTVNALFVRNETLYTWPSDGTPQYLIAEGTKVRRGEQVFWADAGGTPQDTPEGVEQVMQAAQGTMAPSEGGVAPMTAIVSYVGDGYEKRITPETMMGLDRSIMGEVPSEATDLRRAWVRAGEPVYRITDNNTWYLVFWKDRTAHNLNEVGGGEAPDEAADADADNNNNDNDDAAGAADAQILEAGASIDDYTIGRRVTLGLGDARVSAKVQAVEERTDGWFVVIESDRYYEDLDRYRKKVVNVIFEEYSGAVIGEAAIAPKDGQDGVYVKQQSGYWKWVPVKVLRRAGSRCLVAENTFTDADQNAVRTVNYYDEVMSDPAAEGYGET